mgnify:CR=1 FL=1
MKQMLIVIKETYLRQVKSWSFFLMVLSPFLFIGLTIGVNYFVGSSTSAKSNIALITDQAPVKEGLKGTDGLTFDYKDEAAAKKAMKEEEIKGILTVEEKDGQLEARYQSEDAMKPDFKSILMAKLSQVQQMLNVSKADLSQEQLTALSQQVSLTEKIDEKKEGLKMVQTMVAGGIGFLLYMILIFYSSITAQEVASEKGTKIMEVVFSSIRASHYFYARMIALLLVILTHIGIYVVGGLGAILFFNDMPFLANSGILSHLGEAFSVNTLLFVLVSLFMYVVLAAFLGSMVSRPEDAGKALSPLMILIIAGFVGVTALGAAGDNLILKIGSYIPFISTFFMPFRAINGYANSIEAWISLAITVVFAVTATAFIGRMYASLVLQTDDLGIWKTFKRALSYH